ncbi:DUF6055 domain-containing protein [Carboxylicivirga linearis]|uniref:T9SS type A sorting domain-containing protein n=1 Tax=Carboxylicivirga linearis TaxID=1628157 RepID=A0ABS5JV33_9BACT|nr:DUF6055 domain-containing protein [Carboxylicivirga linearis]MBS2098760.1 T9SS type A sorting domain-containing protein [Carboxylicivirga linearis]
MKQPLHLLLIVVIALGIAKTTYAQSNGDIISVEGKSYQIVGDNMITNPGFENGYTGWTDATTSAAQLTNDKFTLYSSGGIDNSQYLVGTVNESSSSSGSIGSGWNIEAGKMYYFSYHVKYLDSSAGAGTEQWCKVSLTNNKTSSTEPEILINATEVNGGGAWTQNQIVFTNSTPYNYIVARFRWLNNRLGFDSFSLFEIAEIANTTALENLITEAEAIYDVNAIGADDLQVAINAAKDALNDPTVENVNQAIDSLDDAITQFKLLNASADSPLDMTDRIINQGFDDNLQDGWDGIGVINYHCVEFYQKTFDMNQMITGLPAGKYRLTAQGFERPSNNDGGAAYNAGTEVIHTSFYAGTSSFAQKSSLFNSLYQHTYTGSGSLNGYVNSMSSAQTVMTASADNYLMELNDIMLDEGDTLVFGARSDFQQNYFWVLFDNFRLEYIGQFDSNDLAIAIEEQITVAQGLLEEKMQNTATTLLTEAVQEAQQTIAADPLIYDDLYAANQSINSAITIAKASVQAYINLQTAIDEGTEELELISGTRADNLQTAIDNALLVVGNLDASLQALADATSAINNIIKKKIYIPGWMMGDVNDPTNAWSMDRSKQSKNWIVFWEPGYGKDPSVVVDGNYRINVDHLLEIAENAYEFYTDSLKFISRDGSKSSQYKMIIRLRYTRDWEASGSGVDDMIGLLTLTAWSAQVAGHTMAHEVGHCFQYQVHCDNNNQNGWMYGFGSNASGGNGWWEQCAQWQGFKVYPNEQFTSSYFAGYLNSAHKHILHEAPRYENYFIQDFWTYKHGMDFIGRLWNESIRPEDPVETYKRITGINQSEFNNEMYECAARFATWDIPALIDDGTSRILSRPQTSMADQGDDYWLVNASDCPENYGYNVIMLNTPTTATRVSAFFEGKSGMAGYRRNNILAAGWRYGFVVMLRDGTRVYSEVGSASYNTPQDTLHFDCPNNASRLWLVVSGAPTTHWRHAWDDDDSNDEQWPYQVKFNHTNLYGHSNVVTSVDNGMENTIQVYSQNKEVIINQLPQNARVMIYTLTGTLVANELPSHSTYSKQLASGMYIVNIQKGAENYTHKILIP